MLGSASVRLAIAIVYVFLYRKRVLISSIPLDVVSEGFLAQMSFSPDDFFNEGEGSSLFISIAGKAGGGGVLGALLALDENGDVFKELKAGSDIDKFDPRGVYFLDDGNILVSDASDPILLANSDDFVPSSRSAAVPEPSTGLLIGLGLILGLRRFTRSRRAVAAV